MAATATARPTGGVGAARPDRAGAFEELKAQIEELKTKLDLLELARRYTDLKRCGREWWARCPIHGERTASFKVNPERQRFHCFGCGAKGDVIDLVAAIEGLDTKGTLRRLRELVGGATPGTKARAAHAARRAEADAREAVEAAAKREAAQRLWRESVEIVDGSPWVCLTRHRRITRWDCDRLRFHPACGFGWIDTPPFGFRHTAPAILAPVNCHETGYVVGVWRIRLTPAGELVGRAGLGDVKGNAARLYPAEGDVLAIAEGVEDALAFHELTGLPTWAALNATNMAELILPPRFRRVLIVQDNDPPDRRGRRPGPDAAQALAHRLLAEGRAVEIKKPTNGKDANDVLLNSRNAP